jgi:cytidylate kinase
MTINELMKSAEKDESLDRDIDRFSEELGKKEDNFVISSHMAAFFIPHAFKVFLRVEPREGARRVFRDSANREDESYSSLEEAEEALEELVENNRRRYRKLYKHDPYEGKGYDLVIDTTDIPSGEVAERVLGEIKKSGTGKPSSGQPDS